MPESKEEYLQRMKRIWQAEQREADLNLQLAIHGFEEKALEILHPETYKMMVISGLFGMVAQELKENYPKQYPLRLQKNMKQIKEIDDFLVDTEEIFLRAQLPDREVEENMSWLKTRFGIVKTMIAAEMRSERTLVAASTEKPKMLPGKTLKQLKRGEFLKPEEPTEGLIVEKTIYMEKENEENAEEYQEG